MHSPHGPPSSTAAGHGGLTPSHHNHPANNISFKSPLLAHLAASSARLPTTADQHHHHAGSPGPSPRHPGHAPSSHHGGYATHHTPPPNPHHQPAYTADPHDMSVMSTADMSFQSRANASDFMSPLLPRQLQQSSASSPSASGGGSNNNNSAALTDLVHGTGTLNLTDRSPTLAHAPLQPMHAPGSSGNREYEQLMRIYGWQESPTMAAADPFYANPLLAASTVNLSAAAKFNAAYDAPPVPPTPSMAAGVLEGGSGKAHQDQSGSWTGFLGKLRGKSSKPGTPPAEPQPRSRQGSGSGPSGAGGALAALSSLAKRTVGQEVIPRFGRRGSDSSLNPPPSSRFAPLSSTSPMGQPSASARAGGGGARRDYPDRDDASFTSFTLHGDEPLRSPAAAHLRRYSGGGYADDTVDEDGNVGNTTEYFVQADTTEVVLTPGGAAGYMGRTEHRRANSDQTVHSVMAMSMSVGPNAASNHPASTVPGGHATAAAVEALRPATAPTHAQQQQQAGSGAPAPVPIAMHRSDSGFHMLDSGIHRDSVAAASTVSGSSSSSSEASSAGDRRRQGFATYRLTQAPPLSYDNMDDEAAEDDAEVVIDDDEQPLGATMSHQHPQTSGGRPIALTVPPRSTSIKPTNTGNGQSQQPPPLSSTPSSMSLTSPSSLDLASGGHSLMLHENSTVLNVSSAPASATNAGEFGLPPSGHPFWTNPRIFDPPTPAKGASGKTVPQGEIPPVVWEVSPIDASRKLMAASPVKLIEVLTTTLDYHFLTDFFLVYRSFMSPLQLALMLILRFRWAMMHPDSEEHALVRFRTFIVLRHWITEYYIHDFSGSRPLRYLMIVTFINAIAEDPVIRAHPRDYRLVKTLKRLLRSQDQEYKHLKQLHTQTVGNPMVSDLACWVHQLSVEKHFEAVYYPILMLVKEGNGAGNAASVEDDGHSRDSGIVRSMSGSGPNSFAQQQQQQQPMSGQQQLRGSNMSTGSTNSTVGSTGSIASSSGSSAPATSDVTGMGVPAALAALVCSKRSFLLTFKIESIADQFMLIEEMMLLSIPWPSLIQHAGQAGKAKPPPGSVQEDRGPVQSMIDRFNATCQWVATEVCSQRSMDDRVKVIEKLIRLAVRSQHLGNYSTVNQITLGLQNPYVERLRKTWTKISNVERRQLRELVTLTAPLKNFSPLRAAMAAELERGGGIPFTGVLLSDLVYNREMPSNLGKSTLQLNNAGIQAQPGMSPFPTSVSLPVINYHKFRVMASTLDQFRQFQKTKRPPGHNALDVAVYANCLCLHTVPNDELQRLSYECERK